MKIFTIAVILVNVFSIMYIYEIYNLQNLSNIIAERKNIKLKPKSKNKYIQVYIECKNIFNPPLQTIPSYRIQCTNLVDGYECGETKAYLDFIINNYDNPLADIYIFMHGHNKSWHYINPLASTMKKLINSSYIENENYGGFQCYWNYAPTIKITEKQTMNLIKLLFKNTNVQIENFGDWSFPCCGTFFIHTNQIKKRPKSEYIQIIENIKEWSNRSIEYKKTFGNQYDGFCGRIFEMMWNRILSNTAYVKLPPYCKSEEKFKINPILSLDIYKIIYK